MRWCSTQFSRRVVSIITECSTLSTSLFWFSLATVSFHWLTADCKCSNIINPKSYSTSPTDGLLILYEQLYLHDLKWGTVIIIVIIIYQTSNSKVPLESQVWGTSLFTSSPKGVRVRFPGVLAVIVLSDPMWMNIIHNYKSMHSCRISGLM